MKIDTPEQRKLARSLLLLGLDALDAFDREERWAKDRGKFSQAIADRRRVEARTRGEELATRFNELRDQYEGVVRIAIFTSDAAGPIFEQLSYVDMKQVMK